METPPTDPNQPVFKHRFPHLVVGIVFLIAVAGAAVSGIYYWKTVRVIPDTFQAPVHKTNVDCPPAPELTSCMVNETQKQLSSTANWKTYTDGKFGYTMKYPSGYTLYKYNGPCLASRDDLNGQNVSIYINSILEKDSAYQTSQYQIDIRTGKIIDFEIYINDKEDKCVENHYSGGSEFGYGKVLLNSENIKINGYEVLKRNYVDTPPSREIIGDEPNYDQNYKAYHFSSWRFEHNGVYYTLVYDNGITVDPEKQIDLFNIFLSTFKFIDKQDTGAFVPCPEGKLCE